MGTSGLHTSQRKCVDNLGTYYMWLASDVGAVSGTEHSTCGIWANSGRIELNCRTPSWCGRISCYRKEPTGLVTELFCVISEFFLKQFPKCNLKAQKQRWIDAHYLLSGLHPCLLRDPTSHSIKIIYPRECLKEPQCSLRKACSYEIVVDWIFAPTFICWSPKAPHDCIWRQGL